MPDEKEYVSVESFNELKGQLDSLTESLKSFQRLSDGLKKDIKGLKGTPASVTTAAGDSDDPNTRAIAELREQNKLLLKRDEERAAEVRDNKFSNTLRQILVANGIDAKHVDHAIAYTKSAGVVRMDEDGSIIFRVDGIDQDASQGAKKWAQSDESKIYQTPRGGKGSGQNPSKNSNNTPVTTTDEEDWVKPRFTVQELEIQAHKEFFGG